MELHTLTSILGWAGNHVAEIITMVGIVFVTRNTRATLTTTRQIAEDKSETDAEIAYRNRRYAAVCSAYKAADLVLLDLKDRLSDFYYPKTAADRSDLDTFMQTSFSRSELNKHKAELGPAGRDAVDEFSACWTALQEQGYRYVNDGVDLAEAYDENQDEWDRQEARKRLSKRRARLLDQLDADPDTSYKAFVAQMERDLGPR